MQIEGALSYGREWLATIAGPLSNILFAFLFAALGKNYPVAYLFAGAQAVLGVFNLLPIAPLDGHALLWITTAVLFEPDSADRVTRWMGFIMSLLLWLGCAGLLILGSGFFPLLAATALFLGAMREIGLVKPRRKR